VDELVDGIRRVTLPLPTRPGHVHAYLLPGEDGWTLVDTGVGLPDAVERWRAELAGLDGPVARIVVTHFHPGRARRLIAHHRERLDVAEAALDERPQSGYELSYPLFGGDMKPAARRSAVAETLSHLERLVREGRAVRTGAAGSVAYTQA
jgi:glyoxylase-like metal-dependent hydrolase (beta-lactamase superfamily II)